MGQDDAGRGIYDRHPRAAHPYSISRRLRGPEAAQGRPAFEPEPIKPTYCAICGDVAVEAKGQMCDFCASPEQIAERAEFDAWRENIRLVQLEEIADAPRTEAA